MSATPYRTLTIPLAALILAGCAAAETPPDAAAESAGSGHALSPTDIEGAWRLTRLDWNEDAPAEPAITLVVEGDRVSGHSGCNQYFGTLETGEGPGELRLGPLGGTRKACPPEVMALERRYLSTLGAVRQYRFVVGQLVLAAPMDGETRRLVFVRSALGPGG